MVTSLRVLILEDNPDDAELMLNELHRVEFVPIWRRVETRAEYLSQLSEGCDVILADYSLPQFNALQALQLLQTQNLDIPFIVVTGSVGEELAVECIKQGAADYLLKDRLARLGPAVMQALHEKRIRDEKRQAEERIQSEAQIALALARVGQGLIASLDTPTILDHLCHLISNVLQCESSHTLLWQPQDNAFVSVACWGSTSEQWEALRLLRASRDDFIDILIRLESEDIVWQQTARTKDLFSRGLLQQLGVTECLWMALRRGGEVIGLQAAAYRTGEPFLRPQRECIGRGVAQLASLALNNARLLEQAERASRIKSDFLSMMSHELRTPLHVIMGYNSLLLENESDPVTPTQTDMLLRIEKNAKELLALITATLDMSRLEAGRVPLIIEEVDVYQYIEELVKETEEQLREKTGLRLEWRAVSDLPVLHTDPTKLKIVLKNLLGNAIKFTDEGAVTLTVSPLGDGIEFRVSDTGIGIAPDVLPYIFEMFRQGDALNTRRHGGVGLGLYVAQQLLELLEGMITVESAVGQGSTFRAWIPIGRQEKIRQQPKNPQTIRLDPQTMSDF